MVKSHLEDRLEAVRHDSLGILLECLQILEHREMGKVYGPLANHHHVVSCDVGIRRVLLCGGTPSPKETKRQGHGKGSDDAILISHGHSSCDSILQRADAG